MNDAQRQDVWAAGDLYEPFVGRWSRLVARSFLAWLAPPPGMRWLDIGCGTGALTATILEQASPGSVKAVDWSPDFVAHAEARSRGSCATFEVGDAQSLPVDTASVDVAVSGLMLNFIPKPSTAAAEMKRVVLPGGSAAAYVWDYAGKMELLRHFWDAAVALDPSALELDEGRRFPICQREPLAGLFALAGFGAVDVCAIDVTTDFCDFDDYWSPFLGGQGPAPGYAMSLSESRRAALRDRIRSHLPIEQDGSIHLIARAWAVRGVSPTMQEGPL